MFNFKGYLEKLRSLSDNQKKAIVFVIVIALGLIMGGFWVKSATEKIKNMDVSKGLPFLNLPVLDVTKNPAAPESILETTSPSDASITK